MTHELLPTQATLLHIPHGDGHTLADLAISATTDVEAVSAWLVARGSRSANTFDSYRRHASRLLLWCDEQRLGLRDLTVNHVHAFYHHLAAPPQHWLRPRKVKKDVRLHATQVLTGPLHPRSIAYARTVLGQMCGYLLDSGYLTHNSFHLSMNIPVLKQSSISRYLDRDSWDWLWKWLSALPSKNRQRAALVARNRWLFALLYHTGIRREEAATGRMSDFIRSDKGYELRVVGKGNEERFVTVNSALLDELSGYRKSLGMKLRYPVPSETMPLVGSIYPKRRGDLITPRAIGKIVSIVAKAALVECDDEHIRKRIEAMSTHWMRHTNATHRLLAGASLETTQDELGHKDLKTTRIYAAVADERRREDAEKLAHLADKKPLED